MSDSGPQPSTTTPRISISALTFSGGDQIAIGLDDIVVIVGPNNSGKSALLRAIDSYITNGHTASPVVTGAALFREGSPDDVRLWLEKVAKRHDGQRDNPQYIAMGASVHQSQISSWWTNEKKGMQSLGRFFVKLLAGEARLQAANATNPIAISEAPSHPLHYLYRDDIQEKALSKRFRRAFGLDLIVHRAAGSQIPLHVGEAPAIGAGEDRVSSSYVIRLESLPRLDNQGDGMRSFAGILLHTAVGRESVLMIDEPEAFLHPPQARLLGRMLVEERSSGRQVFIATHSGDVLRGILDSASTGIRIVRLDRVGDINKATELDPAALSTLWKDPLLRYSNVLDGVFHERVIVVESDSDCRFYAAVADSMRIADEANGTRSPDTMFVQCGGKHRIPVVLSALRALGVPTAVVTDFDVLSSEQPLRTLVERAGGDWASISADWKEVKTAIESKKPELSTLEVVKEINALMSSIQEPMFPAGATKSIQGILRRSSPWATAKAVGKAFVPSGQPTQACNRLLASLRALAIHVVPVGELEGFARSIGNHGPSWVNEVLSRDLASDVELAEAREFVSQFAR
jgi:hypothetical protein